MHARVVLGVGKGVLFREVPSVQECPHRVSKWKRDSLSGRHTDTHTTHPYP